VIIFQSSYFVAVPTIGCIVPGYLLVIPKRHVLSMAQLNDIEIKDLNLFVKNISTALSKIWAFPIIFEHGPSNKSTNEKDICRNGSCIDHAHWHLVPGQLDLLSHLPTGINVKPIKTFNLFRKRLFLGEEYLYYRDSKKKSFLIENPSPSGQFLRQVLAKCVGKEFEWDYLAYPHIKNIQKTLKCLKD
jgi:diadenosine tetraphosphate (Ap4A) HIT family hydrolase